MSIIRKVWTCHYIGPNKSMAPSVVYVPSLKSTGMPSGTEIIEALKKMGYDDGQAHGIAMGGSNLHWRCE